MNSDRSSRKSPKQSSGDCRVETPAGGSGNRRGQEFSPISSPPFCLVPAILVVTAEHDESSITERTRKPLVISTHTIGLHETPASVRGFDVGVDCGELENAKRRRCGIQRHPIQVGRRDPTGFANAVARSRLPCPFETMWECFSTPLPRSPRRPRLDSRARTQK